MPNDPQSADEKLTGLGWRPSDHHAAELVSLIGQYKKVDPSIQAIAARGWVSAWQTRELLQSSPSASEFLTEILGISGRQIVCVDNANQRSVNVQIDGHSRRFGLHPDSDTIGDAVQCYERLTRLAACLLAELGYVLVEDLNQEILLLGVIPKHCWAQCPEVHGDFALIKPGHGLVSSDPLTLN